MNECNRPAERSMPIRNGILKGYGTSHTVRSIVRPGSPAVDRHAAAQCVRMPSCSEETVLVMRAARVSAFLASSTQRTHSLRWVKASLS